MCLDAQGKRLVVATHHGLIAVFNFQAGQMLHSYNHKGSVSALLFLDRTQTPLMAVGWYISVFSSLLICTALNCDCVF